MCVFSGVESACIEDLSGVQTLQSRTCNFPRGISVGNKELTEIREIQDLH